MLNWANCIPPAAEAVPEGVLFSQIVFAGHRLFWSIHCSSHFDWHLRTELETPDAAAWEAGRSCWGWTSPVSYRTTLTASRSCACLFHPALPFHPPTSALGPPPVLAAACPGWALLKPHQAVGFLGPELRPLYRSPGLPQKQPNNDVFKWSTNHLVIRGVAERGYLCTGLMTSAWARKV